MKVELELVTDKRYRGKFVAVRSLSNRTVVASGDDPSEVSRLAIEKGIKEPIVFYVPEDDTTFVYKMSKYRL